jgi:hypothetical protein
MQQKIRYPRWYARTRTVLIALGLFAFPTGQAVALLRPAMSQLLITFLVPFCVAVCVVIAIGVCEAVFAIERKPRSEPTAAGPAAA